MGDVVRYNICGQWQKNSCEGGLESVGGRRMQAQDCVGHDLGLETPAHDCRIVNSIGDDMEETNKGGLWVWQ